MKVLIVEDDLASQKYMEFVIKKEGYEYQIASDGAEGYEMYRSFGPDMVLSDINMAVMNGLEMLQKIREHDRRVFVVMMTAFNSENYVIDSIKLGANNYLKKPIKRDNLISILRTAEMDMKKKNQILEAHSDICEDHLSFKFETKVHLVPAMVDFLTKEISSYFETEIWLDLKVGLSELLMNAVEHGNLGISYEEKSEALQNNELHELYQQRLQNPQLSSRSINISYDMKKGYCEWIIEDEGAGFDYSKYEHISPERLEDLHGRGIFICQRYFDEVEFVGKGNKVRVRKYVKAN